jgi:hypothetical protein
MANGIISFFPLAVHDTLIYLRILTVGTRLAVTDNGEAIILRPFNPKFPTISYYARDGDGILNVLKMSP